ncbi:MAG TPA: M15 family metallopeptidase [Trichocoleus sp.]
MKPYQTLHIRECGEPLEPIPQGSFALVEPHYYESLGAPYGDKSPYYLRRGVLAALHQVHDRLAAERPGWRIQVFDAYRPVAVQQFMVDFTFQELCQLQGLENMQLTEEQRQTLLEQVYQFWAAPSLDPTTPPPHSTGAAIDVTLVDEQGNEIDMGSPIDEISSRSFPEHFADSQDPLEQQWHHNRSLLNTVMRSAGFRRHPNEWWHFSLGDQLWAWLMRQETGDDQVIAHYGRAADSSLETSTEPATPGVSSPKPGSFAPHSPAPGTALYP